MSYILYETWFKQIIFLKDKIILPDGKRVYKTNWVTPKGFNIDEFNKFLRKHYNKELLRNN